jgi:3-hydroxyacyl-CoA dehydrogenase / enoyl-CoA hydratase / 3-hydroxybutyryl-CoA epimerase
MRSFKLGIRDDIAELTFDLENEKVNKLTFKVLEQLEKIVDEISINNSIKLLLIKSAKNNIFIAGADIKEITAFETSDEVYEALFKGHKVLDKIENLTIPTVAYINGACMGGGLELALTCKYRVASTNSKTVLSFPEIELGFFPGLGGTIRTPKLIGLIASLDLILSAKKIDAKKAYRIGLVDEIFDDGQKEFKLENFIQNVLNNKIKPKKAKDSFLESFSFTRAYIYKKAYKGLEKKVNKNFTSPYKALEVIKKTFKIMPHAEAIKIEAKAFSYLAITKESKYLINLFFIFEKLNKNFTKTNHPLKSSVVVGNGVMGKGIIWLFSKYLNEVRIRVRKVEQVQGIFKDVSKIYEYLIKSRRMTQNEVEFKLNKISYTDKFNGFSSMDFIIEAIVEDKLAKKELFKSLEENINKNTIIASNTSSLSIQSLSENIQNKKNFVGVHFFNPVNIMPLVEVIPCKETSKETINRVFELLISCGKTPILVNDCAGFVVNRILLPYLNEAAFILEESSNIVQIDSVLKRFGMPMGPFTLADTVGIDIGYKVSKILNEAYGSRMPMSNLLEQLYELKLFGKKSNEGFYTYNTKQAKVNSKIKDLQNINRKLISEKEIINRCMFIMINEASRILEEKIVVESSIIDFAMVAGTGFPAYKGGILSYANEVGIDFIVSELENYEEEFGLRFKPSELLKQLSYEQKDFNTGESLWKL